MMPKIIGGVTALGLPKPSLSQKDPQKGDYIHDKEAFVDSTLTQTGLAADAEAVGKALGDISSVLDAINGEVV